MKPNVRSARGLLACVTTSWPVPGTTEVVAMSLAASGSCGDSFTNEAGAQPGTDTTVCVALGTSVQLPIAMIDGMAVLPGSWIRPGFLNGRVESQPRP